MKYVRQLFLIIYVAVDVGLVSTFALFAGCRITKGSQVDDNNRKIPAIISFRPNQISNETGKESRINKSRQSLITVRRQWRKLGLTVDESVMHTPVSRNMPSLYVLNAAALTKLHAIDHLTSELVGYNVDVALITETHI